MKRHCSCPGQFNIIKASSKNKESTEKEIMKIKIEMTKEIRTEKIFNKLQETTDFYTNIFESLDDIDNVLEKYFLSKLAPQKQKA